MSENKNEYTRIEYRKGRSDYPSFYVQGISAYSSEKHVYEYRSGQLKAAGFERLRSEKGDNGKYWELWYLSSRWSAKGQIDKFDDDQILRWLMKVGVGSISFEGEQWGAGID